MVNQEKVIKGLECCTQPGSDCAADCPYINARHVWMTCTDVLMTDALALLKVQEPVEQVEPEPKDVIYDDVHRSVYCPSCDNRLAGLTYSGAVALETEETPNYCWMCGQAVKW